MSRTELLARIAVGVVVERRKVKSVWADFVWRPVGVLAGKPDAAPWIPLYGDADRTRFYAGPAEVTLYRTDCGNYSANLVTDEPKLWVVLRATGTEPPYSVVTVTADPGEAEALTACADDIIEALPMPASICAAVAAFVAEHHAAGEAFYKRQRDRADPEALAQRSPLKDRQ